MADTSRSFIPVIAKHAVGDPFLRAIDDVVFPIRRLLSRCANITYVRAGVGFGYCKTDALFAAENLRKDLVLEYLGCEFEQRGRTDDEADEHGCETA
jgi:hypothetical protein